MAYITLEEAKAQVVCEHSEDDAYLLSLIDVAEATLANMLNRPLADVLEDGAMPPPLRHAALILIARLYRDREGNVQSKSEEVAFTLANLFIPYRLER